MRVPSSAALAVTMLSLSSVAQAGFLDRLRGSAAGGSAVDAAAAPAPPSEPSLDAFGGSAGHATAVVQDPVQAGAPSVSRGQGAVKTATPPVVETVEPVKPYDGLEFRTKYYVVSWTCRC